MFIICVDFMKKLICQASYLVGGDYMTETTTKSERERRFHIPKQPCTTNKSIRFPEDMVKAVEEAIRGTDCTFSAFVIAAVYAALSSLAEDEAEK